ncbi:hypothetical protein F4780DRAFT_714981 [Xylariomycetidae sp. FL0641]|nr:hypothetical protein F4780DRAFT_714981 [Xylariomycetidae sp. FL0641]
MFDDFAPRHLPLLFAATTTTFGGMWSLWDAPAAMRAFGLPERVAAAAAAAAPVMNINNARTTALGLCMWTFYLTRQRRAADTVLMIFGAYAGLVDTWVVWKQGRPRKALFRLVGSFLLSAAGWAGWTAGTR